jgi:SAM-dependent methyltransferase
VVRSFSEALDAALEQSVAGWDFDYLNGRMVEEPTPWSYGDRAAELVRLARGPVVDLGTGGGDFYAGLAPLPPGSMATEGWPPNIEIAARRLGGLGVPVVPVTEGGALPLKSAEFAVVLDRHEEYDPAEVYRVLVPGGVFLNQQVMPDDAVEINDALGAPPPLRRAAWSLDTAVPELEAAGFTVVRSAQGRARRLFFDIGALVYFLRLLPWQVPDFDAERYAEPLRRLHLRMSDGQPFICRITRFIVEAARP